MPVRFLPEFAYFSRWFNFYGPQNRTYLFCFYTANSVGLAKRTTIRYKYTKDVIGHRRSLCGLASQGSHYPYPNPFRGSNPFWSVLLLQITLDLLLHRPRKSLIDPRKKDGHLSVPRPLEEGRFPFACLKRYGVIYR